MSAAIEFSASADIPCAKIHTKSMKQKKLTLKKTKCKKCWKSSKSEVERVITKHNRKPNVTSTMERKSEATRKAECRVIKQ